MQRADFVFRTQLLVQVFQRDVRAAAAEIFLAGNRGTIFGQRARLGDVVQGIETISGTGAMLSPVTLTGVDGPASW